MKLELNINELMNSLIILENKKLSEYPYDSTVNKINYKSKDITLETVLKDNVVNKTIHVAKINIKNKKNCNGQLTHLLLRK